MAPSREVLLLWFIVFLFEFASSEEALKCEANSKSPYSKLRSEIFCSYDTRVRPVKDPKTPVKLNATFHIRYLSMVDEENILRVHTLTELTWRDEFIKWNPADYGGVQVIAVDSSTVWTPDLTLYNDRFFYGSRSDLYVSSVHAYYTGLMYAVPEGELSAHCNLDVYKWPFDRHTCKAYVGSTDYNGNEIDIELRKNRSVNMELYLNSSVWELESVEASKLTYYISAANNTKTKYVRFLKTFTVKRFSSSYFTTIGLPVIICVCLTLASFWINPHDSIRCIAVIVSLAAHISFLQYLGNHLPANAIRNVLIVVILRDSLLITFAAFITACVNRHIRGLQSTPPHLLVILINKISTVGPAKFLMLPEDENIVSAADDEIALVKSKTKLKHEWVLIATLIDRSLFFAFFCIYIILFLVYSWS